VYSEISKNTHRTRTSEKIIAIFCTVRSSITNRRRIAVVFYIVNSIIVCVSSIVYTAVLLWSTAIGRPARRRGPAAHALPLITMYNGPLRYSIYRNNMCHRRRRRRRPLHSRTTGSFPSSGPYRSRGPDDSARAPPATERPRGRGCFTRESRQQPFAVINRSRTRHVSFSSRPRRAKFSVRFAASRASSLYAYIRSVLGCGVTRVLFSPCSATQTHCLSLYFFRSSPRG